MSYNHLKPPVGLWNHGHCAMTVVVLSPFKWSISWTQMRAPPIRHQSLTITVRTHSPYSVTTLVGHIKELQIARAQLCEEFWLGHDGRHPG